MPAAFARLLGKTCLTSMVALAALVPFSSRAETATGSSHTFALTYRSFGVVTSQSTFTDAGAYEVRFEGCYAKHSKEAVCAFTLRARRPIVVTNAGNLAHGVRVDGSPMRSCCLFIQGEPEGHPLLPQGSADGSIAIVRRTVGAGREVGFMLRLPDYQDGSPLQAIVFSRGEGDAGVSFPAVVVDLP